MATDKTLKLRKIQPKDRVATSVGPSVRRQWGMLNRRSKREMGAKGIPPWRARKLFR